MIDCMGTVRDEIEDGYTMATGFGPYMVEVWWCQLARGHAGPHSHHFDSGEIMEWPVDPRRAVVRVTPML